MTFCQLILEYPQGCTEFSAEMVDKTRLLFYGLTKSKNLSRFSRTFNSDHFHPFQPLSGTPEYTTLISCIYMQFYERGLSD